MINYLLYFRQQSEVCIWFDNKKNRKTIHSIEVSTKIGDVMYVGRVRFVVSSYNLPKDKYEYETNAILAVLTHKTAHLLQLTTENCSCGR